MKRIFKIILNLLVLAALIILIFMAWPLSGFNTEMQPYINTWFYIGVAAAAIVALYVLAGVIRSFKGRPHDLVEEREGGSVQISSSAIATTACKTAKQNDYVRLAEAEVRQAGKDCAIDMKMNVEVMSEALEQRSIKGIAEEIKTDVSRAVENFSGYPINNFDIKVDVEEGEQVLNNRDKQYESEKTYKQEDSFKEEITLEEVKPEDVKPILVPPEKNGDQERDFIVKK